MGETTREIQATRNIGKVKAMLDELASNPRDYDTAKLAVEIHDLMEDKEMVSNKTGEYIDVPYTPNSVVTHVSLNARYRIVFEQAASTKGVLGFKVEANGDDEALVRTEAERLLEWAKEKAPMPVESK